jgi:integrase
MYTYCIDLKIASENPVSSVKSLPLDNGRMRVVSFEEEGLYLAACSRPLHDVAVLMLDTGMRPDEIYRMKRENVNLVAGYASTLTAKAKWREGS